MNLLATLRKISGLLLFFMILSACHKQTFENNIKTGDQLQVDSVAFSTGSPSLIADGQSALGFIIQTYNKQTLTIEGKTFDSMVVIPADRIAASSVKVLDEQGTEYRDIFSTTSATPASKTFHAEVMGITSAPQTVNIQATDTTFPKLQ